MTKKLLVLITAVTLLCGGKLFAAGGAKAAPVKQQKVVETRINEADMDRLASAVNRAVKEAVIAKQGPSGFEYMAKRMKPPKNEKWQGKWNELGGDGWEAVDHFENVYIFKRAALGAVTAPAAKEPRVKPAAAPAKAEPAAADDKAAEKAAKKADKEKDKAAKKTEKDAKKAAKEKDKAAKKAEKDAKKKAE